MISFPEIKKVISKFGLKPTSSREMSFFSFTCIALGYTELLKEFIGYSYETVGSFGENGKWHSFFNEQHIADCTGIFLKKHRGDFDMIALAPARKLFEKIEKDFFKSRKLDAFEQMRAIYEFYPRYFACIGVYNCFWRYIGNEESKSGLSGTEIKKIAGEREVLAKFYPKVEKVLKQIAVKIGKENRFDGCSLLHLTYKEMGTYLTGKLQIREEIKELSLRKEKYFYLYIEKNRREEVVTNKKIIEKIYSEFYSVSDDFKIVKGFPVSKGIVRGRVHNLQQSNSGSGIPKGRFILVASMTRPDDVSLVKRCVAIVTDEGGILSHAAVVARELNKPCVIGTKIATKVLKDGDLVEVDADSGVVRILRRQSV